METINREVIGKETINKEEIGNQMDDSRNKEKIIGMETISNKEAIGLETINNKEAIGPEIISKVIGLVTINKTAINNNQTGMVTTSKEEIGMDSKDKEEIIGMEIINKGETQITVTSNKAMAVEPILPQPLFLTQPACALVL